MFGSYLEFNLIKKKKSTEKYLWCTYLSQNRDIIFQKSHKIDQVFFFFLIKKIIFLFFKQLLAIWRVICIRYEVEFDRDSSNWVVSLINNGRWKIVPQFVKQIWFFFLLKKSNLSIYMIFGIWHFHSVTSVYNIKDFSVFFFLI